MNMTLFKMWIWHCQYKSKYIAIISNLSYICTKFGMKIRNHIFCMTDASHSTLSALLTIWFIPCHWTLAHPFQIMLMSLQVDFLHVYFSQGTPFTHDFVLIIQIHLKIHFAIFQILADRLLQKFTHAMTAVLSWHVQIFVAITWLEFA